MLQGGGYAGPITVGNAWPTPKANNAAIVLEDNAGLSNVCLTLAMARSSAPDSATSEFFINVANNNFLDDKHTTFGKVVSGMDVVSKIAGTATGQNDRPNSPMIIESISLE